VLNELVRYGPSEVIANTAAGGHPEIRRMLTERIDCLLQVSDDCFKPEKTGPLFLQHFGKDAENRYLGNPHVISTAGGLLSYLHDTQKTDLSYINQLNLYTAGRFMELDYQTRRNLELTETMRSQDKKGSLLWVLDKTRTAMGGRLLRSWLEKPLLSPTRDQTPLNAVSELSRSAVLKGELGQALKDVGDMERLIGRVVYGNANCRDMTALAESSKPLPEVKSLLQSAKSALLAEISRLDTLDDMCALISAMVCDSPPFSVREGGMIRKGYDSEVDRLRALTENAKGEVASIEAFERERTGIKKLKVGYNKVFGYYIEMPRSRSEQIPTITYASRRWSIPNAL
jgi:DNA mismatch repair protein MutS